MEIFSYLFGILQKIKSLFGKGTNINAANKIQTGDQSQVIVNAGNNPTFISSSDQEPYILDDLNLDPLIKSGILDESKKPWRFTKHNINPVLTKDGKRIAVKPYKELWLTHANTKNPSSK